MPEGTILKAKWLMGAVIINQAALGPIWCSSGEIKDQNLLKNWFILYWMKVFKFCFKHISHIESLFCHICERERS
jgi:hypothetical protein